MSSQADSSTGKPGLARVDYSVKRRSDVSGFRLPQFVFVGSAADSLRCRGGGEHLL
jgi:hypothetical protein